MGNPAFPPWTDEFLTTEKFKDAVSKAVDPKKILGVPFTPAKAETTGVKGEGTGVNIAGNLVKVEGNFFALQADVFRVDAVFSEVVRNRLETSNAVRELRDAYPNESRKQIKELVDPVQIRKDLKAVETDIPRQIHALKNWVTTGDTNLRRDVARYVNDGLRHALARIDSVERDAGRRTAKVANDLGELNRELRTHTRRSSEVHQALSRHLRSALRRITTTAGDLRRAARVGDQQLRTQISALRTRIGRISQVAHSADQRSKSVRIKANDAERKAKAALNKVGVLDSRVKKGLDRVEALEGSARKASGAIKSLRKDVDDLKKAL